ncbi:MAG: cupin domain-containing protein [Steroidobacteraceae bacterium]
MSGGEGRAESSGAAGPSAERRAKPNAERSDAERPEVPYWHLWTDERGMSRQTRCLARDFELSSISPPASPQWLGRQMRGATTLMMTVLPAGWVGDWHENPKPQWIIPLSGCWFVESMDGQRVEMGPGEISLGADIGTRERDGKRGHRSGTVGAEPAVLWLVQFETTPPVPVPPRPAPRRDMPPPSAAPRSDAAS